MCTSQVLMNSHSMGHAGTSDITYGSHDSVFPSSSPAASTDINATSSASMVKVSALSVNFRWLQFAENTTRSVNQYILFYPWLFYP